MPEANLERRRFMRLLLVEDDLTLGDAVRAFLKTRGHAVDWVTTVANARANAESPYDVILLDWRLPDGSGVDWLRQVRSGHGQNQHTPVLLLTARDSLDDRVEGLDAGADDYLIKPFQLAELAARIRATSRRAAGHAAGILTIGEIALEVAGQAVTLRGTPVALTAHEYAVLEALMRRAGHILSRTTLEERLYGFEMDVSSNTVEVHVASLRRKLGHDVIETVRGMGYRMKA